MRAAILAVGSELLGTDRIDSNSLKITKLLERFGVELVGKLVVGDENSEIASGLKHFLPNVEIIIMTGGLGPTEDDLTREAVAETLDRKLCRDETLLQELRDRFASFGMRMSRVNEKQADVIDGATVLRNPHGTAPGLEITEGDCTIFLFPGVPSELEWMLESAVEPWLMARIDGERVEARVLRVACLGESNLEERILPAYREFGRRGISVLSSPGDVEIRLIASGSESARRDRLDRLASRIHELVGDAVYAEGEDAKLEATVGALLAEKERTIAIAESCTGGLVSERLTRVAGSSAYFLGGIVAYDNAVKTSLLGVSAQTVERWGAVSREVVAEMSAGVAARLDADLGVAISGIAGPDGGTAEKPVGTVFIGIKEPGGDSQVRELHLPGERNKVRWLASQWTLELVRRRLLGRSELESGKPRMSRESRAASGGGDLR
ncbi:MAG: competence/damage-inducible protein A [Acidobacteriota bacterium]